jgi:hypothetical protein
VQAVGSVLEGGSEVLRGETCPVGELIEYGLIGVFEGVIAFVPAREWK